MCHEQPEVDSVHSTRDSNPTVSRRVTTRTLLLFLQHLCNTESGPLGASIATGLWRASQNVQPSILSNTFI